MNKQQFRALPYLLLLLPFDLVVAITILLMEIIALPMRLLGRLRTTPARTATVIPTRTATIQILNWDGKHLLEECLPSVIAAVAYDGGAHEILVVDNGSTDGSVEFVQETFPQVRVLALDRNYRFGPGNNRGVRVARTDIVVFLNNDMVVERGFIGPLLDAFSDASTFAAASQVFFADPNRRREETGKTRGRFEYGFIHLWHDDIHPEDQAHPAISVFWAGGGACAFDRRKYLEIGGLDPLYYPLYVEDTDLSYQAWKRGWKCVLAPESKVVHKHRGTSRPKLGDYFVDNTIRKNQFLFIWKNVTDFSMIASHLINLPRIHGRSMMQADRQFEVQAFLRAFRQLPEAMLKRLANMPSYVLRDQDVLKLSQ